MKDAELKEKIYSYSINIIDLLRKHNKKFETHIQEITLGTKNDSLDKEVLIIKFDDLHLPFLYMRNKKRDNIFFNITKSFNADIKFQDKKNSILLKTNNEVNFDIDGVKFSFNDSYNSFYPLIKNKDEIFNMLLHLKVQLEKTIRLTKALDTFNSPFVQSKVIKAVNVLKENYKEENIFGIISCVKPDNIPTIMEELIKDNDKIIDIPNLLANISYGWGSTISYYGLYKDANFTSEQGFQHYRNIASEIESLVIPIVEHHNLSLSLDKKDSPKKSSNNFKI